MRMTKKISPATVLVSVAIIFLISLTKQPSPVSAQFLPFVFPPTRGGATGPLMAPPAYPGFNPMMSPYGSSIGGVRPMRFRARPASPARQCRKLRACPEMEHGTTLPATWQSSSVVTTTLPPPTTRLDRSTTTFNRASTIIPTTLTNRPPTTIFNRMSTVSSITLTDRPTTTYYRIPMVAPTTPPTRSPIPRNQG